MSEQPDAVVEIKVQYTRTERLVFPVSDLDGGMRDLASPQRVGQFLRSLQYHVHSGKSLIRRETPALLEWRFIDEREQAEAALEFICALWWGKRTPWRWERYCRD